MNMQAQKATVLTAIAERSTGYGRAIRDADGSVLKTDGAKDATPEEQQVKRVTRVLTASIT